MHEQVANTNELTLTAKQTSARTILFKTTSRKMYGLLRKSSIASKYLFLPGQYISQLLFH